MSWDYPADHNHGTDVTCAYCNRLIPSEELALYDDDAARWFCNRTCMANFITSKQQTTNNKEKDNATA